MVGGGKDREEMSDLISRNELIYKIRGIVPGSQDVDFIIGLIENQPTAFDTEKVIEQLENEKERYEKDRAWWSEHSWKDSCVYNECDMNDRKSDCFEEAIDIVKKGGVE